MLSVHVCIKQLACIGATEYENTYIYTYRNQYNIHAFKLLEQVHAQEHVYRNVILHTAEWNLKKKSLSTLHCTSLYKQTKRHVTNVRKYHQLSTLKTLCVFFFFFVTLANNIASFSSFITVHHTQRYHRVPITAKCAIHHFAAVALSNESTTQRIKQQYKLIERFFVFLFCICDSSWSDGGLVI